MRGLPLDHFDLSPEAVRTRFEWAVREGNPYWFWPETTVAGWQAALFRIERAARLVLTGSRAGVTLDGDAGEIGIAAYTSGMGPLLAHWAARGKLEAEPSVRAVLDLHLRHNTLRMERLTRRALPAVEALADAGISVTVLKGMHTAQAHFPHPGTRPMSDIDLLIEPAAEPLAAKVLRSLGYLAGAACFGEQTWRMPNSPSDPRSLSLVHRDDPWYIDLHTSLSRRYSPGAPLIELDRAIEGRAAAPWSLSPKGSVLPAHELALHLACHASSSLGLGSLTMLRLTELGFAIGGAEGEGGAFWDRFLDLAERTGSISHAWPALHFANGLAPGVVPRAVLRQMERQAPAAVRRVMRRLTPATCQRVLRCSFEERFMWTRSPRSWMREILRDLVPELGVRQVLEIYRMRFWRVARGTLAR